MVKKRTKELRTQVLEAALKWVRQGCFVLALHGKVPLKGSRGYKDATDDPGVVAELFKEHPDADLGLWPGGSGRLVIDIDTEEGSEAARKAGLFDLGTPIVRTGRNEFSCHIHLKRPAEFDQIGNLTLANGWEFKCDLAHVVIPPSIHGKTQKPYTWENEDAEPADLPEEVLAMIREALRPKPSTRDLESEIHEGERNNTLFSEACRMVRRGDEPHEILATLMDINRTSCRPPLEETEVQAIANSAERHRALDAEAFLDSLEFDSLTAEEGRERRAARQNLLQAVQDWRSSGPTPMDEALVREEVLERLNKSGVKNYAKMWDTTDPPALEFSPEQEPITPPPSPEVVAAAEELLLQPNLLEECIQITNRMGHIGEEQNRQIILLAGAAGFTARSYQDVLNLVLRGDSSSGKNELLRRVLELFPPDFVHMLTGVSEQALQYYGDVIRGVLVFQELEGQKDSDYTIRQAMSEGVLRRWIVQDLRHAELRTELRCSIITTTTSVAVHDENDTRVLMLDTDGGEILTKRVLESIGQAAAGIHGTRVSDHDLEVWRTAMAKLKGAEVVVTFMPKIAEEFPAHLTRARRDIKKTVAMIAACTILHQYTRNKDAEGRFIAALDDYEMVYPLLRRVLAPSMSGISEKAIAIDDAREELRASKEKDGQKVEWVALAEIINRCGERRIASAKTVRRWANDFDERGIWEKQQIPGNRYQYRSLRPVTEETIDLPTPNEIELWMHYETQSEGDDEDELSEQNRDDRFSGDEEE